MKVDDVLLRYKTNLLMKQVVGPVKEFKPNFMMMVMDCITIFEDRRLQIKFYDRTKIEVTTE